MNILILALYGINLLIFTLALLWILVPVAYGLPSRPTRPDRIRKALKLVKLQPDEVLYDLGAGDGRVLLIAAREFDANAVGVEVAPVQCALIWLRILFSRLGNKAQIQWGNFFKTDLNKADVVYIYATSTEIAKLAPHLEKQMRSGARVVSISADFPKWEPSMVDPEGLIFTYVMPPQEGNLTTYMLKNSE